MNINEHLKERLEKLNDLEDMMKDSKTVKEYISNQRIVVTEIQLLLYKALKNEYPCHGLTTFPEMYEHYQFDIVVKPKL